MHQLLKADLANTSMLRLAKEFDDLATGRIQVPSRPVQSTVRSTLPDTKMLPYHDLLSTTSGPLFSHFMASIPGIIEEMSRVGTTLIRYTEEQNRRFFFWDADAFDGTNGRTLAKLSDGRVHTFTNSPNPSNEPFFHKHADPSLSRFYQTSMLSIDPDFFAENPHFSDFREGFDFIYETAAFQFYGTDRNTHIAKTARHLKPDGLMFFLEKLCHHNEAEYHKREDVKDNIHKSLYFTREEIEWKKQKMLQSMHTGLVTIQELSAAIFKHFKHAYLLWNGTNFYEIVASNDRVAIERFISLMPDLWEPQEFMFENVMCNLEELGG